MFSIYKLDTGEIKRVSKTNDLSAGEGFIEGEYSSNTHYVKNGEALELPPKLSDEPVFDYILERWVYKAGLDISSILSKRQRLLADSDWTQIPDVSHPLKTEWAAYRQALRDITLQPNFPLDFLWPRPPKVEIRQPFAPGVIPTTTL